MNIAIREETSSEAYGGIDWPVSMSHLGQLFGAEPKNPDDDSIAIPHDNDRKQEHHRHLIPSEQDTSRVRVEVTVSARLNDHRRLIVVEPSYRRVLERNKTI